MKSSKEKRYFLSSDQSSHWYIIPVDKSEQWFKFLGIDEDDPKSWKVPKWAKPIGGHPRSITFCDPK